jgi:hypothetical protein
MGAQLTVYVGAYLKVEAEKILAESPYICQGCGNRLTRLARRLKLPSIWDLLPDNDDEFLQPDMKDKDSLVLLSNIRYSAPDHVYMDESDEIEVTPIMMGYHLKNFRNNHKESIEKLRIAATKLTIKFGIIQYYF